MKTKLIPLFLLMMVGWLHARPVPDFPFADLFARADLVVIAVLKKTNTTSEKEFIDHNEGDPAGTISPGFNGQGQEALFGVSYVFKGDKDLKEFTLRYYAADNAKTWPNGPQLLYFPVAPSDVEPQHSYLLYLLRDPDGRYRPVTGQFDPAYSARELTVP